MYFNFINKAVFRQLKRDKPVVCLKTSPPFLLWSNTRLAFNNNFDIVILLHDCSTVIAFNDNLRTICAGNTDPST